MLDFKAGVYTLLVCPEYLIPRDIKLKKRALDKAEYFENISLNEPFAHRRTLSTWLWLQRHTAGHGV
jgi:hypothetical protein